MRNFPAIFTKFLFQKNLKMLQLNAVEQTTVALARHIHVAFLKSSRAYRTVCQIYGEMIAKQSIKLWSIQNLGKHLRWSLLTGFRIHLWKYYKNTGKCEKGSISVELIWNGNDGFAINFKILIVRKIYMQSLCANDIISVLFSCFQSRTRKPL